MCTCLPVASRNAFSAVGEIGRAAGVDRRERREVVPAEAGRVQQGAERGDRADRERRPVLDEGVEDDAAARTGRPGPAAPGRACSTAMCPISPVMWNSGAMPKIGAVPPGVRPVPVDLRGEHDVPVGVHRALGHARRPRRVGQERDVVRRPAATGGGTVPRCSAMNSLKSVVPSCRCRAHAGEQPLVVAGLELQLAGGQDQPHVGVGHDLPADLVVQRLQRDQHRGPGVLQQVGELPLPAHRVDRHHDAAGLPGGDHGDDELRHVLQVDRQPVARRRSRWPAARSPARR